MALRPTQRASLTLFIAVSIISVVIHSALLSGLIAGTFDIGFITELFFVIVLPIIGYGVSTVVSMGPDIPIWAWYIISLSWLGWAVLYRLLLAHASANLKQQKLKRSFISSVFSLGWFFFVGIIGYIIGYTNSLALENTIGFVLLAQNPLYFVIPLFSGVSAFTFTTPIWIAIVILWGIWLLVFGFVRSTTN